LPQFRLRLLFHFGDLVDHLLLGNEVNRLLNEAQKGACGGGPLIEHIVGVLLCRERDNPCRAVDTCEDGLAHHQLGQVGLRFLKE